MTRSEKVRAFWGSAKRERGKGIRMGRIGLLLVLESLDFNFSPVRFGGFLRRRCCSPGSAGVPDGMGK